MNLYCRTHRPNTGCFIIC